MRWKLAVAMAGGVLIGGLAIGALAQVDDDAKVSPAGAQTSPDPSSSGTGGPPNIPARRTITVDAVGSVSGVPDVLTINLGVRVRADTAGAALRGSSEKANALIATLKQAGVADVDITTTDVGVWPQYDRDGQRVTGYEATNGVNAKLRDLSKAGELIDTAAQSVGDAITLGGLSFAIDDAGPLYAKARELAMQRSREQAEQLAKAANVGLGEVLAIEEASQQAVPVFRYAAESAAGAAAVPLQPGSQQVQLSVRVTYAIA